MSKYNISVRERELSRADYCQMDKRKWNSVSELLGSDRSGLAKSPAPGLVLRVFNLSHGTYNFLPCALYIVH